MPENPSPPPSFPPGSRQAFPQRTVAEVEALTEADWPERPSGKRRKRDRDFERKVDELINAREQAAAKFDIEGSLIAPRAVLECLAAGDAKPSDVLLKWQRECLGMTD